ncbi:MULTISPECIES: SRPBCC family protein [unclassified Nocardiopsis]|uniref:SRPBCC family protein n=1 Tax=unclassified Nocardiopsis TaxID=2649073 RepID=UPI00135C903D|nr:MULTISPECIES: SRPBCC family protein [unclassified Nocardiopsis]
MTEAASSSAETHREVGRRTIDAGEAHTALIRRTYDAPVQDVWNACTDPKRINRWFMEPTGDFREGGHFALEGNASGKILRCEEPSLLALTWEYGDDPVAYVELRLSEAGGGGTVLELEHASVSDSFLVNNPETGDWGVGVGWEMPLDFLESYLKGETPDAPTSEWFEFTPELEKRAAERGALWAREVEIAYSRSLKGA